MAASLSRYSSDSIIGGERLATARTFLRVRAAINNGSVSTRRDLLRGAERLDTIAGREYGDGRLWWLIAAASGIGWGLQVPPGTVIVIPKLSDIIDLI